MGSEQSRFCAPSLVPRVRFNPLYPVQTPGSADIPMGTEQGRLCAPSLAPKGRISPGSICSGGQPGTGLIPNPGCAGSPQEQHPGTLTAKTSPLSLQGVHPCSPVHWSLLAFVPLSLPCPGCSQCPAALSSQGSDTPAPSRSTACTQLTAFLISSPIICAQFPPAASRPRTSWHCLFSL